MKLGEILVSLTTNILNSFSFWFWRLGPRSWPFLSFQPVLFTQQVIMSLKFFILLKVCTVGLKIVNHQLPKTNSRHDINIFWKSLKGLELQLRTKYLRKALVFIWNSALRENLISVFKDSLASIDNIFFLGGRLSTRV